MIMKKARIEILVNLRFLLARGQNITGIQTMSIDKDLLTNGFKIELITRS